jgi:hypothetical protein
MLESRSCTGGAALTPRALIPGACCHWEHACCAQSPGCDGPHERPHCLQARSLRWKELLLEGLKGVFAQQRSAGGASAAAGARCTPVDTWLTTAALGALGGIALVHVGLCAAAQRLCHARGRRRHALAAGAHASASREAAVAVVMLPGAAFTTKPVHPVIYTKPASAEEAGWLPVREAERRYGAGCVFADAANLRCTAGPLAVSLAACVLLFLPAAARDTQRARAFLARACACGAAGRVVRAIAHPFLRCRSLRRCCVHPYSRHCAAHPLNAAPCNAPEEPAAASARSTEAMGAWLPVAHAANMRSGPASLVTSATSNSSSTTPRPAAPLEACLFLSLRRGDGFHRRVRAAAAVTPNTAAPMRGDGFCARSARIARCAHVATHMHH